MYTKGKGGGFDDWFDRNLIGTKEEADKKLDELKLANRNKSFSAIMVQDQKILSSFITENDELAATEYKNMCKICKGLGYLK